MSFFRYAEAPVVETNVGTLELYFTFVGTFITGNTLSSSPFGTLLQHLKDMVLIMQTRFSFLMYIFGQATSSPSQWIGLYRLFSWSRQLSGSDLPRALEHFACLLEDRVSYLSFNFLFSIYPFTLHFQTTAVSETKLKKLKKKIKQSMQKIHQKITIIIS